MLFPNEDECYKYYNATDRVCEMLYDRNHRRLKKSNLPLEGKWGGFVYIYKPGHPNPFARYYVRRAHLVMEDHLGRLLKDGELVCHINSVKDDDRLENLILFANEAEKGSWWKKTHREQENAASGDEGKNTHKNIKNEPFIGLWYDI